MESGTEVDLTLSTTDAAGHAWRSAGRYRVGAVARPEPGRDGTVGGRPAGVRGGRAATEDVLARLPVERIDAPLLAVAGDQDAMWPAATMASDITDRRGRPDDELLVLPGSGHFLRPPATPTTVDRNADLVSGGTPSGIAQGQRRAWDALRAHLAQTPPSR